MQKSFLFLQGPASKFFARIGNELLIQGHKVLRINFAPGDKFFWNGENTADYKHPLADFAGYISDVARLRKITDLVVYDENSAISRAAIEALKNHNIRLHVFSDGIFGDNWITLEEKLVGNKTAMPKDPRFYLRSHVDETTRARKFAANKLMKMLCGIQYHLAGIFARKVDWPTMQKTGGFTARYVNSRFFGVVNFFKMVKCHSRLRKVDYFLADYDLSQKASFLRNFATSAPVGQYLVFFSKGEVKAAEIAKTNEIARRYGVAGRVVIIQRAKFSALVKAAKGYITNDNWLALLAIAQSKPVLARESVAFNIHGLANQCTLEQFWHKQTAPDMEVFRKFRNYIMAKTQVNGSLYDNKAMREAAFYSARKLMGKSTAMERNEDQVFAG